jgi:hypothetical protein
MRSRLKPDSATGVGLITAVGVYLIYQNALPSLADVRTAEPDDPAVESSRKVAAWESAGLIALVFLVARDFNSFIISGAALVGIDYMYKHGNGVNPQTNKLVPYTANGGESIASVHPLPEYATSDAG